MRYGPAGAGSWAPCTTASGQRPSSVPPWPSRPAATFCADAEDYLAAVDRYGKAVDDRVERAEQDLAAATDGVTPETPLRDATEQLNAAAFGVEVAGLRLLADAGCLTGDQEQRATAAVVDYTSALQADLQGAGYYGGAIDGIYGPATVAAVESLQADAGLPVTGLVDQATSVALDGVVQAQGDRTTSAAQADTAAVQGVLKVAGYWTGPVDGEWTAELTEALAAFQTALDLPATGAVDAATLGALEQQVTEATAEPPDSPAEEPQPTEPTEPTEPTDQAASVGDGWRPVAAPASVAAPIIRCG